MNAKSAKKIITKQKKAKLNARKLINATVFGILNDIKQKRLWRLLLGLANCPVPILCVVITVKYKQNNIIIPVMRQNAGLILFPFVFLVIEIFINVFCPFNSLFTITPTRLFIEISYLRRSTNCTVKSYIAYYSTGIKRVKSSNIKIISVFSSC